MGVGGERVDHEVEQAPPEHAPATARPAAAPSRVVRRLVVGSTTDPAEDEADRMADRVVASLGRAATSSVPPGQSKVRRSTAVVGAAGGELDGDTAQRIDRARGGGRPLDPAVRAPMEQAFGADFSGVRMHVGGQADDVSSRIQARAFTTGNDVFVRREDYRPSSTEGTRLIAHELAHTVQSGASRVRRSAVGALATGDHNTVRRLMSDKEFKKASGGAFSGKRDRVLEVDQALLDVATATSRSVALDNLINKCQAYLANPGIDKTRKKGVTALLGEAITELAAWRMRARIPLPDYVFRMDERTPETIAQVGFQPWKPDGGVTIIEHVRGVLDKDNPAAEGEDGKLAKKHSQFVSTAADLEFAKDPTLAQGLLNKYFYKIATATQADTYTDVGAHFDGQNVPNPYEKQLEFVQRGGIPAANVIAYCKGKDLLEFVLGTADAGSIAWADMPAPA